MATRLPTQAEADAIFAPILRELLAQRSRLLARIDQTDGLARQITQSAADLYHQDARTLVRIFGGLQK